MYTKKHLKMKLIMNLNTECPLKIFKSTLFENKNYIPKSLNNRSFKLIACDNQTICRGMDL